MRKRIFAMAAAAALALGAKAQFVIEMATESDTIEGNNASFEPTANGGWTFGGRDISTIDSIKLLPIAERLANFETPTYPDYYRSTSGWDDRDTWNLANVHDPSIVRADDGYYYMYTTDASFGNAHSGHGHFHCRRSRNLVDWEYLGATMQKLPEWVEPKLNEIRAAMGLAESATNFDDESLFGYWAPCVRLTERGIYRMYYAITCPGTLNGDSTWSERAFIGMMETETPSDINSWEDKGYILTNASDKGLDFNVPNTDYANCYYKWNAIDPTYIITNEGEHWLIYGSWHSGFAAMQMDAETGMPLASLGMPWGDDISAWGKLVNTRQMGNRWQGSEAPEVIYRDGYYYLFMAYDELSVAYNTRVARSENIDGPYVDINGTNISDVGGDAFPIVTHPYKFSQDYGWVGISHCAVFDDGDDNWYFASQGRLPADAYGDAYSNAIMQGHIRKIAWTEDGWPVVMPERYSAVPQAPISESELTGSWENIALDYKYGSQDVPTVITLHDDHTVGGDPFNGETWSLDAENKTLNIGTRSFPLMRETDWEASPRAATIVYAGLDGARTMWGKKPQRYITYGPEDNSVGFWETFTPYMSATGDSCTFHFRFTNYTDQTEVYNNWVVAVTNGEERKTDGYVEYVIIRADPYAFGDYATEEMLTAGMTHDYNWETFMADMDGADVDLTVKIVKGTLTMKAVTTTAEGKTYNYSYTVSGLPEGRKGAFLTMENAHLTLDNYNTGVGY